MTIKKKISLLTMCSFALIAGACGSDDSESTTTAPSGEIPTDSTFTPTDSIPADIPSTGDTTNPADTSAVLADSAAPVFTIPEEAAEIIAATTIPPEEGPGLLIDDFEDGDNLSKIEEQYWYTYDDKDNKGASTILTPLTDDGYPKARRSDNGTNYVWAVYFNLDKGEYEYDPYVGWGVWIDDGKTDFTKYGGVTYWFKGAAHELHVETSDIEDYDVHLASVKASRVWKKVVVRFKDLRQGGWGEEKPFEAAHIQKISFQAKGNGKQDSVLIDNLYLQDTSEVEKDKADMTIKDAEIPEVEIGDISVTNELQAKAMKYLNKGINITNWLEENGTVFKGEFKFDESDVKLMADNGIKGLRLPIDLDQYVSNRDDVIAGKAEALEFDDANLFGVLDSFVVWTGKHNMAFTIDYHEYDNGYNTTTAANPNYTKMMAALWKHVAAHYADNEREDIFYELLNEPDMTDGKVTSADWRKAAQEDIDSIRTVDKKHSIIFGDAAWYSIDNLAAGSPLNDDNVIYAIHTYEPFVFTHQSASWAETKTISGLTFPYDKEKWSEYSADFGVTKSTASWISSAVKNYYKNGNKMAILKGILPAKEWAVKNNVPVIINEFGAYNAKTDKQSVLNYMTAMREISDTLEIPLTHWGYTGGFALFESTDGIKGTTLIEGMKEAYGLE